MDSRRPDALADSQARVLRHGPDGWVLEVERLEYAGGRLYRPTRYALRGAERIAAHLREGREDPEVRARVEALLEAPPQEGEDAVFRFGDDGVEAADAGAPHESGDVSPRVEQLEARVNAMGRTIEQLRSLERRLSAALAKAQRGQARADAPAPSAPSPSAPSPSAQSPSAPAAGDPGPSDAAAEATPDAPPAPVPLDEPPTDAAGAAPQAADADAAPDAEPAPTPSADADQSPAPAQDDDADAEPKLTLPGAKAWAKGLETLLGESFTLREEQSGPPLGEGFWLCPLIDDDDARVGAICGDLRAVVLQGSLLMMLSETVRDEQLEAGEPSEDVLEAMSEIFNVQSRCVNDVAGNPHVRTTPIARFDAATHGWLEGTRARLDLLDANQGRTVLVSL